MKETYKRQNERMKEAWFIEERNKQKRVKIVTAKERKTERKIKKQLKERAGHRKKQ